MRRLCTCGKVDVAGWYWRRGVFTASGFHRLDGEPCQLKAERTLHDDRDARDAYEAERKIGERPWTDLNETERLAWRTFLAEVGK